MSDNINDPLAAVSTPWLTSTFEQVITSFHSGRLPHGLLFTGSIGIGKYKLARNIAQYLLCSDKQKTGPCLQCHSCHLFSAENHLDFYLLQSESDKAIGIEQVRGLIEVINERPNLGENKVVLIKHAQQLTTAAANALLKTLEEPQGNTYIILLANTHQQLLPTMLSRVQHTHLQTPHDELLLAWLAELGFIVQDKGILRLFQNSPLALLNHFETAPEMQIQDERVTCIEGVFALLHQPESMFDFSRFLAESVERRLQLLFYLLHDIHKLKLSSQKVSDDAVYGFALPQLQLWQAQLSLQSLRYLCSELLQTCTLLVGNKSLKKELLINALLIKIKNEFKEV